jgi:L-ascorbate metabolism protein UlaG (beta-lactamase superfamily)
MTVRIAAFLGLVVILAIVSPGARASDSQCLAMAEGPKPMRYAAVSPAAVAAEQVQITYVGHSTFLVETHGGVKIATDYAGYAGGVVPDVVTMNHAHSSHYTDTPDPQIKHVLRGWNPEGGPARHDITVGDVRIRNVPTDIRSIAGIREKDGNSIFVFEVAGLCIGHLGHLHHELSPEHIGQIGRLDIVMVPVDGGYTMAQANMMEVLKTLKARIIIPMHYFGQATLSRFLMQARPHFDVETNDGAVTIASLVNLPQKPKVLVLPGY